MKRKLFHAATAGTLTALLAAPVWMTAQAQQNSQPGNLPDFQSADVNSDSYVSFNEAQQVGIAKDKFTEIDSDKDLQLSRSEYDKLKSSETTAQTSPQQGGRMSFRQLDQDSSGALTPDEAFSGQPKLVQQWPKFDQDDSGKIEQSEFSAFQEQQASATSGQQQPSDQMSFQQLDRDSNGALSQDELQQVPALSQNWQQYDQDNSGRIEQSEFAAFKEQQSGQQSQQKSGQQSQTQQNDLSSKTAGELKGMSVSGQGGDEIGKVQKIVQNTQDNKIYAVVAAGGFLGMGEDRFVIALDQLSLQDNKLVAKAEQGQVQRQAYSQQNYQDIQQDNMQIGQLQQKSGTQQQGGMQQQASFAQLDKDQSGALTPDELKQHPQLSQNWQQYDQDNSGRIEQAEFAAFQAKQSDQGQQPSSTQ